MPSSLGGGRRVTNDAVGSESTTVLILWRSLPEVGFPPGLLSDSSVEETSLRGDCVDNFSY